MFRRSGQLSPSEAIYYFEDDSARMSYLQAVARDAKRTKRGGLFLYYFFMVCRVVSLSGSAAVPVLVLFSPEKVITAIIGFAVFLAEILIRVIDPGAHSINQIEKADSMSYVLAAYRSRQQPFDDDSTRDDELGRAINLTCKRNLDRELLVLQRTFEAERESPSE